MEGGFTVFKSESMPWSPKKIGFSLVLVLVLLDLLDFLFLFFFRWNFAFDPFWVHIWTHNYDQEVHVIHPNTNDSLSLSLYVENDIYGSLPIFFW